MTSTNPLNEDRAHVMLGYGCCIVLILIGVVIGGLLF